MHLLCHWGALSISAQHCCRICGLIAGIGAGSGLFAVGTPVFCTGKPAEGDFLVAGWLVVSGVRQIVEPKLLAASTQIHPLAMLATLYFALAANSFLLLVYLVCLLLLMQALRKAKLLPTWFPCD